MPGVVAGEQREKERIQLGTAVSRGMKVGLEDCLAIHENLIDALVSVGDLLPVEVLIELREVGEVIASVVSSRCDDSMQRDDLPGREQLAFLQR